MNILSPCALGWLLLIPNAFAAHGEHDHGTCCGTAGEASNPGGQGVGTEGMTFKLRLAKSLAAGQSETQIPVTIITSAAEIRGLSGELISAENNRVLAQPPCWHRQMHRHPPGIPI